MRQTKRDKAQRGIAGGEQLLAEAQFFPRRKRSDLPKIPIRQRPQFRHRCTASLCTKAIDQDGTFHVLNSHLQRGIVQLLIAEKLVSCSFYLRIYR